jgi:hypothetical protein
MQADKTTSQGIMCGKYRLEGTSLTNYMVLGHTWAGFARDGVWLTLGGLKG